MLKFGNKEFRNIQEQVEKNAKDIEKLIEEGVPGTGSELPTEKPTDNGQILLGNINGSVEWSTETIREFQHELVSGENIKTINGVSILGSGNIQIEGGGSEDNVVEIADNALVGNTVINPYAVDEATMTKLQDPNTIIKYNNYIYYYDKLISGTNTILYKSRTNISSNTAYGQATMYYNVINVRTVAGDYPIGLWYTIDTVIDVPCTLGTNYTEDGDYIWVASKSGDSADSAWQKYTPGSGNNVVVELTNLASSSSNPTVVDEATMQKLKDPNTIIKYENKFYYCHKITTSSYDTVIEYKTPVILNTYAVSGDATFTQYIINVRSEGSTSAFKLGVWTRIDLVQNVPTELPSTDEFAADGDYVWVANKAENLKTYDWKKYTPGSGGSVDLSNYYTKTETDNQFVDNATFNTTTMGINTILNDIPNTYATKTSVTEISNTVNEIPNTYATKTTVDGLETQLRQEISGIDSRVTTLENAGSSGGNFNPQDPITDNGQILVGSIDGTYSWSTQTIQEIWDTADGANTTANNNTTNIAVLDTKVNTATTNIAALDTRVTALENAGGSGGGGGTSYTFTNGLTESNGTVSNDFYKSMRVPNSQGNIILGICENEGVELEKSVDMSSSMGCLSVARVYRNSWTEFPSIELSSANGSIAFGRVTGLSKTDDIGIYCSGNGNIVGGYSSGNNQTTGNIRNSGMGSVAIGIADNTTGRLLVTNPASSALGRSLQSTADDQLIIGRCNNITNMANMAFIIGNGTNDTTRSNALTVDKLGNLVAAGTVSPSGADYAEYFEFEDGNPNKEDRIGYLVELAGNKIRFANGTDILGATSGTKCVIGDAEEMNWHGKYERDELGRYVYEDVTLIHNKGTEEEYTETLHVKKISANYDPSKTYIPRSDRPEWAPVGLLGKVLVRQDGTLAVGDYVKAINGIATKSDEKTNIRVLEVVSESIVKLLIK